MKVFCEKPTSKQYLSYARVVPFRTNCPYTSLPISYSPISLSSRELLNKRKRKQFMDFALLTHLAHRFSTTGELPQDVYDPYDDVKLDTILYELEKYKRYQRQNKLKEAGSNERLEESSTSSHSSSESEAKELEYSEDSSLADSKGEQNLRRS
eukprot:ctg_885.g304